MSRLLPYAVKTDPDEDFRLELRKRQGILGLMSTQALADEAKIPRQTLDKRKRMPETMPIGELRKLIAAAKPDPLVVLALIGYTKQDIRVLTKQLKEGNT